MGALALAMVCVALLWAQAASAEASGDGPGFQPPLDLSPGYLYTYPQLAPDSGGGYVYSWNEMTEDRWPVFAKLIPPSGGAAATQALGGRTFLGSSLAGDGSGRAIAAWDQRTDCCVGVSAALKLPGQNFGAPVDVPYGGGSVGRVKTAMNARGEGVIVYGVGDTNNSSLRAVFVSPAGTFGPPREILTGGYGIDEVDVDLGESGEAIVGWEKRQDDGSYVVSAAIGSPLGFTPTVLLSDPSRSAFGAKVAIDAAGGALAAWQYVDVDALEQPEAVMAATRPPASPSFLPATMVGTGTWGGIDVGVSDDGRGLVSFISDFQMTVRPIDTRTADLGAPHTVEASTGSGKLVVDGSGRALVALNTHLRLGEDMYSSPVVAWGDASGGFAEPQAVNCPPQSYGLYHPVLGTEGGAAVLMMSHGDDIIHDTDDRMAIARTDSSAAPCRGPDPESDWPEPGPNWPAPPPLTPAADLLGPRVTFQLPKTLELDSRGRFRVVAAVDSPGGVRLRGRVSVAGRSSRLIPTERTASGPGVVKLRLKVQKSMHGQIEQRGSGRAKLIGTLSNVTGSASDRRSVALRAR